MHTPTSPPPAAASEAADPLDTVTCNVGLLSGHNYPSPHSQHLQQFGWSLGNDDAIPMELHDALQPIRGLFLPPDAQFFLAA